MWIRRIKLHPIRHVAPLPPRDQRHPWLRICLLATCGGGGARRRMTWRQFILALGLHTSVEMAKDGFEAYWLGSKRVVPDKGDLQDYWIEISSDIEFLGPAPSYVYIRDHVRRLCHMMIACSISGRGQSPEKVTGIDLFYLRSIDRGTANVPYLLVQYLFRYPEGRKSEARLNICERLGDMWAWVAQGPERQADAAVGTPKAVGDAPVVDEGAPADPTPMQAPQPPHADLRTMPQRIVRLKEEVHELQQSIVGLHEDVDRSITNQSSSRLPYQRCIRRRTGDASISTAQQDDQLDP
ncbi:hypothetical protein Tco_1425307 [Tanacetum coccineum]